MKWRTLVWSCAALMISAGTTNVTYSQENRVGDDQEVLTRGPVHEAFANPVVFNEQRGEIVSKEPPADVEELPPDQKPEGDVIWIGGYWQWDDDRNDFLWVSGIWRVAPPGLQWTPGYWAKAASGYQWISGFWNQVERHTVDYLPEPPQTLEVGPSTPAPDENQFWVPGTHIWRENRYVWRPGYYSVLQPNWVWVPSHYVRSPLGYVYVDGYWDYAFDRRGVVFAPVYFRHRHFRPNYYYSPSVVLQTDNLLLSFWARPSYRHYYFGDYYDVGYRNRGFHVWFDFDRRGSYRYDPLFVYYRGYSRRNDPRWEDHLRDHYRYLSTNVGARPNRVFVQNNNVTNITNVNITNIQNINRNRGTANNFAMATSLNQIRAGAPSPMRLQQVEAANQRELRQQAIASRDVRRERLNQEARALTQREGRPSTAGATTQPIRLPSTMLGDRSVRSDRVQNDRALGRPERDGKTDGRPDRSGLTRDGNAQGNQGRPNRTDMTRDGRADTTRDARTQGNQGRPDRDMTKDGRTDATRDARTQGNQGRPDRGNATRDNRAQGKPDTTNPRSGTDRPRTDPVPRTNPGNRVDPNPGRTGRTEAQGRPQRDMPNRGNTGSGAGGVQPKEQPRRTTPPPVPRDTNRGPGGGRPERTPERGSGGGGGGRDRERTAVDSGAKVPAPLKNMPIDRNSRPNRPEDKTGRVGRSSFDPTGGSADPSAARQRPVTTEKSNNSSRSRNDNRNEKRDDDKRKGG